MTLFKKFFLFFFISCLYTSASSEIINIIKIEGNDRVSKETIKLFSGVSLNDDVTIIFVSHNQDVLNRLDRVYEISNGQISEIL